MGTHATRRTIERRRMRIVVGTIVLLSTLVIPPHAAAQKPTPPEPSIVLPGGEFQPADQPQGGPPEPPPSFEKILDGPVSGTDAIDQLGIELPTAAAVSGLSPDQLVATLTTDDTAYVDSTGALFYAEPAVPTDTPLEASVAEAGPFPYPQTFLLHSKPDATRKIFLDFDGHTITGTQWQAEYASLPDPFNALPFSLDANAAFSNAELDVIQSVWQRVSEDYAPFNVDVTTEDPGYAGINRSSTADESFGTRVLITDSPSFSPISGTGLAYIGTIDNTGTNHDRTQPAWVFANGVSDDTKNIAELATHESGHNVGLLHDGQGGDAYYAGHGPWAPVMGSGYSQPIVQFSKGEYSAANQFQDDLAVHRAEQHPRTNRRPHQRDVDSDRAGFVSQWCHLVAARLRQFQIRARRHRQRDGHGDTGLAQPKPGHRAHRLRRGRRQRGHQRSTADRARQSRPRHRHGRHGHVRGDCRSDVLRAGRRWRLSDGSHRIHSLRKHRPVHALGRWRDAHDRLPGRRWARGQRRSRHRDEGNAGRPDRRG